MEKTLIISDVHNRTHIAEFIIKNENADVVIFLGDYFDSFGDDLNLDLVRETAKWFSWSINQPNRIHLCGNHDIPYWFPDNKYLECPGFDRYKWLQIRDIVSEKDWRKLKFHYNLDNKWLLSHAGLHPFWISNIKSGEYFKSNIETINKFLLQSEINFLTAAGRNEKYWFSSWSRARSGNPYPGGLLWCDFHGDFNVIIGVNQLVGHTNGIRPRWISKIKTNDRQQWYDAGYEMEVKYDENSSFNLCLDTENQHYAVWDGKKLSVKSTNDLLKNQKS